MWDGKGGAEADMLPLHRVDLAGLKSAVGTLRGVAVLVRASSVFLNQRSDLPREFKPAPQRRGDEELWH